ncbi:RNA polymerase Rpc34 [Cinnamomum micranthum f. kanehirae]|uniref:RNA polymerase Rpc34 n=1 Tax=Cinnamomum micranthum f. kanehirae TaxID=337451 RepID=A0A3S3NQS0_9MAGN|nr:RNA polymerase Rpc34 [Cinnamomum micranthum f. kanehirae]
MGRPPSNLPPKRGRPSSSAASQKLSDVEQDVYNLIRSKEGMGIFVGDLKRELKLQDAIVKKSLKVLESQKLIKGVNDVHHKLNKHYMAVEFEASKEITGGSWYVEGKLDAEFIKSLKELCLKLIDKLEVVTVEGLFDYVRRSGCFNDEVSSHQILEILQALVLDNEIEEVKSTGKGVFSSLPLGKVCYHRLTRRNPTTGILSSIPCGVCPRISECTPDGIISPINCVYFKKWLDF